MKIRLVAVMVVVSAGILASGCSSSKIPCPDVTGSKGFSLTGLFKKKEPTPEDQANEGRDYGGQNMDFDKNGLVKKKKVKLPTQKKQGNVLQKLHIK